MMSQTLKHVIESISPASAAHAEGARLRLASMGAPMLERLAAQLGGAQHDSRVRGARRTIVTVIADHGAGDPGIALGADHPSVIAACAIADGSAALPTIARTTRTPIVIIDAGTREPSHMPAAAVHLGRLPTFDLLREPAMTVMDATLGLDAGIALAISLSEPGVDVLAVGSLGLGSEVSTAALLGALTRDVIEGPESQANQLGRDFAGSPLEILATFGGGDTAVLAGLMLAAASMNVPVILDGPATGAAALVACAFAPSVRGYFIAAHAGAGAGFSPIFEVGLGHGEGTGAAMLLPLIDQVAAVTIGR
jgi:nicotinate-nucleotide--dimethylbenzimidazole phosphoribosyltransferase